MKKTITFSPAFDKRNSNPSKNYGIHGVEIRFVLKAELGAVQFVLATNWQLPHVQKEFDAKQPDSRFPYMFHSPMPHDIGYHSYKPMYEGQEQISDSCEYLDGKPCYYGGSALNAERYFDILKAEGDEGLWKALEQYYKDVFIVGDYDEDN